MSRNIMVRLENLPEVIMSEILSRLPTEDALDCKLVCKPWRKLVNHPSFAQRHLDRLNGSTDDDDDSRSKVCFAIMSSYKKGQRQFYCTKCDGNNCDELLLSRICLNLSPEICKQCSFVGSYDGLICLNSCYGALKLDSGYRFGPTYICNPITRELVILPNLEGVYRWNGFGYCSSTNKYKVVRICFTSKDLNFGTVQVYTVGGGNGWRSVGEMDAKWKNMDYIELCNGAFVNGSLHWVNRDNGAVLAFSLTDEKFSEIPAPPCVAGDAILVYPVHLGVFGDFLSATYHQDSDSSEIWLWKKNEDNSDWSWCKHFSFNSYAELSQEFTKGGRLLCYGHGKIYSYDPKDSSSRMDMDFGVSISQAIPHKNTLISLKALGEKDTKTMEFGGRAASSEVMETSA